MAQTPLNLMPYPLKVRQQSGTFRLKELNPLSVLGPQSQRIRTAARRFLVRLAGRTGLDRPVRDIAEENQQPLVQIRFQHTVPRAHLEMNESYRLAVTPAAIRLEAETDVGILRGLETLLQLLQSDTASFYFPCVEIEDQPRFPWRGLLIDVARHFLPLEVLLRNIDGMAAVKLNVLHLHLTDDQGFRVESKIFPRLHKMGSDGLYYTQDQLRFLVQYADERGIRVVPEFDVPGHTTSWLVGYPELAAAPGPYEIIRNWGIQNPVMDPSKEEVYNFLDRFFGEMVAIFPDPYFHIGGDEVEHKHHKAEHWNQSERIQKFMKEHGIRNNHELQAFFNRRISRILKKYGRIMVGWDEILTDGMPDDMVIQSWRGRESMVAAARKGYRSILSSGYYLDLNYSAEEHYLNDPVSEEDSLTREERARILGGEACMWGEFVWEENIDSRIWPRLAAIAERFWSPPTVCDVQDMYRRLERISFQLEELGLMHEKNYGMMLRRLAGYRDPEALRVLLDVVEPVKGYRRNQLKPHTQLTPLTRIVDTARPDAKVAREFCWLVEAYFQAGEDEQKMLEKEIRSQLLLWKENHARLRPLLETSPVLIEIEPLSKVLSRLAEAALEALDATAEKTNMDGRWKKHVEALLEQAEKPHALVELAVLPAFKWLFGSSDVMGESR
jgi:hexosaminidase